MRSLLPNAGIVYLETNDLGNALESLTNSRAFSELADTKPDFSFLETIQIAVLITNFKTSEKQIGGENAILNFTPQFVAVAETHLWSWQTRSFAENQLDNFVRKNYGENTKLDKSEKENGNYFTWTAMDNRQVFAFVENSRVYFGNDAAAIEKCLAVKKGETESLLKNDFLSKNYSAKNLAFGYVSPEGIAQIADFAGVSTAVETTEESNGRTFIARILPQILRNTTQEIVWTANKTTRGIEDKYVISMTDENALIAKEILATAEQSTSNLIEFLPADFFSATRYSLKNPQIAWRGLLLLTAKNTDAVSGNLLIQFSDSLLESYGVTKAEDFLSGIDSEIITAQLDADGDKSAAIFSMKDAENIKKSLSKEINFQDAPIVQENAQIWFSENRQFAAAFVENKLILGASEAVDKCLQAKQSNQNFTKSANFQSFAANKATSVTLGQDADSAEKIVAVLAKKKDANRKLATFYLTETRFDANKIERQTVSDFGLIGTILKQLEK